MAVRVKIAGRELRGVTDYSVQEDSTPIDPSDESGGPPQINFSVDEFPGWRNVEDELVELSDDAQGVTQGIVSAVSMQNGRVQVTADSRILQLATVRVAKPYQGTLGGALRYYLSLVGITENIVIDEDVAKIAVVFPGWRMTSTSRSLARSVPPMAWKCHWCRTTSRFVVRGRRRQSSSAS